MRFFFILEYKIKELFVYISEKYGFDKSDGHFYYEYPSFYEPIE